MWQLIACRALMGVGAAFIMPSTLSILVNVFPPHERTKAIAIWAGVTGRRRRASARSPAAGCSATSGTARCSSSTSRSSPSRLIAGWFLVPKSRDPEKAPLDPVGAVLSIVGIVALVYGLIQAPEHGWAQRPTLGAFAIAVVVLARRSCAWELRVDEPMLDMRFFRNPAFSTGTGGMILVFLAMYGVMFLITQYFQLSSATARSAAALRFLPMAPIMIIVAAADAAAERRASAPTAPSPPAWCCVGLGLLMFRGLDVRHAVPLRARSASSRSSRGIALAMSPMTASIMSAVPARRAGAGSAMNDATRELGAALGVAVLGSVAASRVQRLDQQRDLDDPGVGAGCHEVFVGGCARRRPRPSAGRGPGGHASGIARLRVRYPLRRDHRRRVGGNRRRGRATATSRTRPHTRVRPSRRARGRARRRWNAPRVRQRIGGRRELIAGCS